MHTKCKKCGSTLKKVYEDADKFTFACSTVNCDYRITQKKRKPAKFVKECKTLSKLSKEIMKEARKCDSEVYIIGALAQFEELLDELREYNDKRKD